MRILEVIYNLGPGGAESLVASMIPQFIAAGNEVDVLMFIDGVFFKDKVKDAHIYSMRCKHNYSVGNILKIRKFLNEHHYDIIHAHTSEAQVQVPFSYLISRSNARLVTTEHSTSNRRRDDMRWLKPLDKWLYSRWDKIICCAPKPEEAIRKYLNRADDKIITISNGVDVSKFHDAKPYQEGELKDENGAVVPLNGMFNVIMVAGLRFEKDQQTVVRAIAKLPKDEYAFWIVGSGYTKDKIIETIHECHAEEQVRFFGARNDIPRILKTANVAVLSSQYEGLSMASIEGMATGHPFIASDVKGLHEMVGGAGLLFPYQDSDALATAIKRLHDDKQLYTSTGEACYKKAKGYDLSITVRKYIEVFESLMKPTNNETRP